jgi:hypothetical protein
MMSALACNLIAAAKTESKSRSVLALSTWSCSPRARGRLQTSRKVVSENEAGRVDQHREYSRSGQQCVQQLQPCPFLVESDLAGNSLFDRENATIAPGLEQHYAGIRPATLRRYDVIERPTSTHRLQISFDCSGVKREASAMAKHGGRDASPPVRSAHHLLRKRGKKRVLKSLPWSCRRFSFDHAVLATEPRAMALS